MAGILWVNGGFCSFPPIKTSFKKLQKIYGKEETKKFFRNAVEGSNYTKSIISNYNMPPKYKYDEPSSSTKTAGSILKLPFIGLGCGEKRTGDLNSPPPGQKNTPLGASWDALRALVAEFGALLDPFWALLGQSFKPVNPSNTWRTSMLCFVKLELMGAPRTS